MLVDKHLVAEYYELPRVFGLVRKAIAKGHKPERYSGIDIYGFGAGHVKFFYARLGWLGARYAALVEEMLRRGMKPKPVPMIELFSGISAEWVGDWNPTPKDLDLNMERLNERLAAMPEKKKRPVVTPYNEKEILGEIK